MSLPIIILAGGLGTRLGNLTLSSPKALIEINEQPFIHHQISYLKTQGLNQVVVSIGHMGEKIQNALGNGEKFGLNISYSEDGKKLLGTGGAVAKAASAIDCENFFVTYGDSFLPIDYRKMFRYFQSTPKICNLMAVFRNCGQFDACNVTVRKNKTMLYDKKSPSKEMDHIDYGLSIINKKMFLEFANSDVFD